MSKSLRRCQKQGTLTTYCDVECYLLESYSTGDVIPDTDAEIMRFNQPLNETPIKYVEFLWAQALRCNLVYNGYELKSNLIKGLEDSISHSMRSFWSSKIMQLYKTRRDTLHI